MIPPAQATPAAAKLDSDAILAIWDFAGWGAMLLRDDVDAFDAASLLVQLASKHGRCWGLTQGEGVADPAKVLSLLAFHTAQVKPSTDLSRCSSSHPLVQNLISIHNFLMSHSGCAVVVPPAPPDPAPAWTLVLPAVDAIVAATEEPAVQHQRQVTAAYMQHWHPHIDVLQRPACTARLANLLDTQKAAAMEPGTTSRTTSHSCQ
eukprot:1198414-Rhodomonas_salina.3